MRNCTSWESTDAQLELYQAITLRVQHALLALEDEARDHWPGPPALCPRVVSTDVLGSAHEADR